MAYLEVKWLKGGLVLLSAAPLVVLYGWVGWQAAHPRVSDEYRLFYIQGALQQWPGPDGLAYRIGDRLLLAENPRHLGEEWGSPRRIGWWHASKRSPVYLKLREVVRGEVVFEAEVVAESVPMHDDSPVSVKLFVNGTPTTSVAYAPAPRDQLLVWRHDGSLLHVGLNVLTLDVPQTHPRTVLRVKSLALRPATSMADARLRRTVGCGSDGLRWQEMPLTRSSGDAAAYGLCSSGLAMPYFAPRPRLRRSDWPTSRACPFTTWQSGTQG